MFLGELIGALKEKTDNINKYNQIGIRLFEIFSIPIAIFLLGTRETYQMLGIMYLAIGAVRAVSMVTDKSIEQSNIISLVVEIIFGIILVL